MKRACRRMEADGGIPGGIVEEVLHLRAEFLLLHFE